MNAIQLLAFVIKNATKQQRSFCFLFLFLSNNSLGELERANIHQNTVPEPWHSHLSFPEGKDCVQGTLFNLGVGFPFHVERSVDGDEKAHYMFVYIIFRMKYIICFCYEFKQQITVIRISVAVSR